MRIRTVLAGLAVAAAGATLAASPAQAAPFHSPQAGDAFTVTCAGYGDVTVLIAPSNERVLFSPAFVVGTHTVAVPYAFTFEDTFNGEVVGSETLTKGSAVAKDPVICTQTASFTDETGTYGRTLTVALAVHGQP